MHQLIVDTLGHGDFNRFQGESREAWLVVSRLLPSSCERRGDPYDADHLLTAWEEYLDVYKRFGVQAPPPPPEVNDIMEEEVIELTKANMKRRK